MKVDNRYIFDRNVTKADVIRALGDRPSAKEYEALRKANEISANSVADGLISSFDWDYTPQGFDYWHHEYMWLKEQEQKAKDK